MSSQGGRGVKNCQFYLVKRRLRGGGGGQKLLILRRHMDDPLVSCYAWKCFISSLHYWDAFWVNHKKCNSVLNVTKSRKNLQRAIRCGLFFRPLGQDLHQKKRDPKWVFSIDFLSASSPMVFLRKRKKKMFLAFAVWLWDITTASIQADYCKEPVPISLTLFYPKNLRSKQAIFQCDCCSN